MKRKKPLEILQILTYVTVFSIIISALLILHLRLRHCNIYDAIKMNNLEAINACILMGADVNSDNNVYGTPLNCAVYYNSIEAAELLIDKGARMMAPSKWIYSDRDNGTKLFFNEIVKFHPFKKSGNESVRISGYSPLHMAARWGYCEMAAMLIRKGAEINAWDNTWESPLLLASRYGRENTALMLISRGADFNVKGICDLTSLHYATQFSNEKVAAMLIDRGAKIDAQNDRKRTPLHYALYSANFNIAKLLIEKGANTKAADSDGRTPLHYIAESNDQEMAEILIEHNANINAGDKIGLTPLHISAENHRIAAHKLLIKEIVDVMPYDIEFCLPRHLLEAREIKDILIKKGFKPETEYMGSWYSLGKTELPNSNISALLISKGADVNAKDIIGSTPLFYAANGEIAKLLIANGAKVNTRNILGQTPLHMVDNKGAAEVFIKKGADVNLPDKYGRMPLHHAADLGYGDIAEILIKNGANVNARDQDGNTPSALTLQRNGRSHCY
ncbi:MAG: ankyrin repeat domain-containing protein [Candidatus Xenobiia bacterium LiM19]